MYRQSSTPCWNGVNCFYLKNHRCHFYHPPQHFQQPNIQNRSNNRYSFSLFNSSFFENRRQEPENFQIRRRQQLRAQQEARRIRDEEQRRRREAQILVSQRNRLMDLLLRLRQQRDQRYQPRNNSSVLSFSWFFEKNNIFSMKSASTQMLKKLQNFNQCPICCEDYLQKQQKVQMIGQKAQEKQKKLVQLYCSHIYHKDCIQNWLKKNQKCAVCRKDFREHSAYEKWDKNYKKRFRNNQQVQGRGLLELMLDSQNSQQQRELSEIQIQQQSEAQISGESIYSASQREEDYFGDENHDQMEIQSNLSEQQISQPEDSIQSENNDQIDIQSNPYEQQNEEQQEQYVDKSSENFYGELNYYRQQRQEYYHEGDYFD